MRIVRWFGFAIIGLFAVLGVIVALGVFGVALLWRDLAGPGEPVPDRAILLLDLRAPIVEADPADFPLVGALDESITLRELIDGIDAAARDDRVLGLFARVNGTQLGIAQIEEIRAAIAAFRAAGKPAYAYAETFGEGGDGTLDYYAATAFDQIWMQPSGELGAVGLRIEMPFIRDMLADLGVEPQFASREDYKSAADMFTRDSMSSANRRNLEQLMRSWMTQIVGDVAAARGLEEPGVRSLIDQAPLSAEQAEQAHLIDGRAYRDDVEDMIRSDTDDATFYPFGDYAKHVEPPPDATTIALVYGVGPIHLGEGSSDGFDASDMGADSIVAALRLARETDGVAAIVFRIDSPGGSYVASDAIWREVRRTRDTGIPIVISMGNVAASGGYFVAAPASAIVADRSTITGSIGVLSGKFALDRLWDDIGIGWDGVGFGANSDMNSFNQPFTEQQWAKLQGTLDRIYADFKSRVAEGRSLEEDAVQAVAQGQIWSGSDALERGLVDEIGGLRKAAAVALEASGRPADTPYAFMTISGGDTGFEGMLGNLEASLSAFRQAARTISKISGWVDAGSAAADGPVIVIDPVTTPLP